ncbi:MAG: hypothetical protein VX455_03915 [Candidatus Neomarinimicrobiota bacterium]|nr:hypothetical protein [Candidatus Neomarinimicrobiota bacterium]
MRKILPFLLLTSLLFPVGGVVIFNDGTTVEGDINGVNANSVYITPIGLSFPEEILMDNVDSLRLYDGKLLVANSQVLLLYSNGQFMTPEEEKLNRQTAREEYDVEYVIIPNWSLNFYTGYPIIKASSFDYYNDINPVLGLSIGSPYGIFMGDFFMNAIAEIAFYDFNLINRPDYEPFGGFAWQIGVGPGFFIGETSISLTACTGIYHAGTGFIAGGSIDLPLGGIILDKYGDVEIVENLETMIEALEFRITGRSNVVQKTKGGTTGWLGGGISLGYEF